MKIALCQINPVIGDVEGNKSLILSGYEQGKKVKADIVIFPELALCGYPPLDLIEKREFREYLNKTAIEIALKTNDDTAVIFGSVTEKDEEIGTGLYNSAIMCYSGKIRFIQEKTLIPNYDVFDEVRYFESSEKSKLHKFKNTILGISVCEDIWNDDDFWKKRRYENDPVECQIKEGAEVLINISASPYSYGRRKVRYDMLRTLTKQGGLPLAYVCCTGAQTDLIFDGVSMCFSKNGELVKTGKKYEEDFFLFDTNEDYIPVNDYEGTFEEEVYSALVKGLKDYANKTGFKKGLVGLSGGIDSALVTCIAADAFGKENVHVIMMPSAYSSGGSVSDSEKLIENLGITSSKIPIQPVLDKMDELFRNDFLLKGSGIAEENTQSRIRGTYLMAYSNRFGHLLCTTGNKSEMAVGYATLYGDMNGAVAVIGDVYKTGVYKLAGYINREKEIIPREIIEKAPSAELAPNQKDQDSLPPYEFLDRILRMYLEEYKEYYEIVETLGHPDIIRDVLRRVDINEFKRNQAAPVLRVSSKAFGYGRRYPIVQGWRK